MMFSALLLFVVGEATFFPTGEGETASMFAKVLGDDATFDGVVEEAMMFAAGDCWPADDILWCWRSLAMRRN